MQTFHIIFSKTIEHRLEASTLSDAKREVHDGWVNTGKVRLVVRTYQKVSETFQTVDTDY